MSVAEIMMRATARAQTRDEKEAVANLVAGYQTQMQTAAVALEEELLRAAAGFRRAARRYLAGLRLIVRGADILRVYKRVTGSNPWGDK